MIALSADADGLAGILESWSAETADRVRGTLVIDGLLRLSFPSKFGAVRVAIDVDVDSGNAVLNIKSVSVAGIPIGFLVRPKAAQAIIDGAAAYGKWIRVWKAGDGNLRLQVVGLRVALAVIAGGLVTVGFE